MEDQKVQGFVEEAPAKPENRESYIPHKEVVREAATSTKLRVVYNASAKATPESPSLNTLSGLGRRKNDEIQILRSTRALFGLAPSPFLLGGVLEAHLDMWKEKRPNDVEEIRRSLYVDEILNDGKHKIERKLP
ncbi:Hypothetical predicted protein [Paramuricea clavata]|uniref:Uncharacterized protein n=1 Tax=Paramuricea clavata TaxID=317549 RepID=A0A7D9K0V1_PARCT|nr:Hypothetical predicted protein [Paramuricea clavata]